MPPDPLCLRCGHVRSASVHHPSYDRPNRCTFVERNAVVDCNSPVAVCLEDAIETEAFELVRAELADFKRAIDTIAAILRPLPLDASRRVFVAAATAVGFPEELIAGFVRGIDIGIASMFYKPHGGSPS